MSIIPTTQTNLAESFFQALGHAATAAVGRIWRVMRHRRAVMKLSRLDEHALNDIGLTRFDVHAALAGRFLEDPSERLAVRAAERWSANRAMLRERAQIRRRRR